MENKKFDIGVIVGRFQIDKLHDGHIYLIESVIKEHKRVVIFLGVSPALVTKNNPLDFATRKEMILQKFPQINIIPIPDSPSDLDWSREIDKRIRECCPIGSVVLYGSRTSFVDYYHGSFTTKVLEPKDSPSGTEVRLEVSREVKASADFRAGVIFAAYNQYAKVYPTVDIAIMYGDMLLLGRKSNEDKFRFPGGYADPSDDSYEMAAKREAYEETGLEIGDIEYVGSLKVDEWKYRSEENKVITLLFKAKRILGSATAGDDIAQVKWFNLHTLKEEDLVDEHKPLLKMLLLSLKEECQFKQT